MKKQHWLAAIWWRIRRLFWRRTTCPHCSSVWYWDGKPMRICANCGADMEDFGLDG